MSASLMDSLRRLGATAIELVHVRLELLSTELEQEKLRLVGVGLWAAAAVVLATTGLAMLAMLVAVFFWDSYRLTALVVLTLVYLGGAIGAGMLARNRWRSPRGAFAASLDELRRDRDALQSALQPPPRAEG